MATAAADNTTIPPISTTTTTTTTATSSSRSSSSSFSSSIDFELASIKPPVYNYTSLRDILPSPKMFVQSPRVPFYATHSGYEISIRNPLVKQAAWAYLQPMSTTHESDGPTFFRRMWNQFSGTIIRVVAGFFDCLLR